MAWTCDEDGRRKNAEEDDVCAIADCEAARGDEARGGRMGFNMISDVWDWNLRGRIWQHNETNGTQQQKEE